MNLGKFLQAKPDPLTRQADALFPMAQVVAQASLDLKDKCVGLEVADDTWWRFFVTVAVVFVAATRLKNLKVGRRREERLVAIVAAQVEQWNPRVLGAFEDCKAFFDRTVDAYSAALEGDERRFATSDTIGAWVVWNVLDRPAETGDEWLLVRTIGSVATTAGYRAWDSRESASGGS